MTSDMTVGKLRRVWRPIPGYDGMYWISNHGEVKSYRFWKRRGEASRGKAFPLELLTIPDGHKFARLFKDGKTSTVSVGKLVLTVFRGPPVDERIWCCHNDGDPANNKINNLRWGTNSENQMDRIEHGTSNRGARNGGAKLTESDARHIKLLIEEGYRNNEIAPLYPQVDASVVSAIRIGRLWAHI